ncbi:MAG: hypothetical protein VXZ96_15755 [Myxococcota bacterium]|nr:hypothetical protein [Myxococcota bacterium]
MSKDWRIAAVVIALAMLDAGRLAWVCDDAFISYRYAVHFVDGIGLVYNAGEQVEGYTNFLWTIVLAFGAAFGAPLPEWSIGLGLGCYLMALIGLAWKPNQTQLDWYALLAGASIVHFRIFATSGLETMMMVACLVWTLRCFEANAMRAAFFLSFLACLIRPEGAALLGLGTVWGIRNKKAWVPMCISLFGVFAYALWKWWYFGDLLPNTYYAKVDEPRWSQGLDYLWASFGDHIGAAVVFVIPLLCWRQLRANQWLSISLMAVYTVHVAKVGGDFMLGRFALPIMACGLMVLKPFFDRLSFSERLKYLVWFMLLWIPLRPSDARLHASGVGQERDWYPKFWQEEAQRQGEIMKTYLTGTDIKMVIYGGQAMLGFYSDAPWILEGMAGLTDKALARMPNRNRRVGHGAKATIPYLQSRGIDIYVNFRIQQPMHPLNWIDFGQGVSGSIIRYQSDNMALLRDKGAQFIDFPNYLDQYYNAVVQNKTSLAQLKLDWPQFVAYYFDHTPDQTRRLAFERLMQDTAE